MQHKAMGADVRKHGKTSLQSPGQESTLTCKAVLGAETVHPKCMLAEGACCIVSAPDLGPVLVVHQLS